MTKKLTETERELAEASVLWLRDDMITRLKDVSPSPDLLDDLAMTNFETGCVALERAGVFAAEDGYWRVLAPQAGDFTLPDGYTREDLDRLLDALACHSGYVSELARYHEPVEPLTAALQRVCKAMANCGYMTERSANSFEWTTRFGPWLVSRKHWELKEFEAASPKDVERALALIPDEALQRLSGGHCSYPLTFVRCFCAQWFDGKWNDGKTRHEPNDDWDLPLAKGLHLKLFGWAG